MINLLTSEEEERPSNKDDYDIPYPERISTNEEARKWKRRNKRRRNKRRRDEKEEKKEEKKEEEKEKKEKEEKKEKKEEKEEKKEKKRRILIDEKTTWRVVVEYCTVKGIPEPDIPAKQLRKCWCRGRCHSCRMTMRHVLKPHRYKDPRQSCSYSESKSSRPKPSPTTSSPIANGDLS